MHKMKRIAALLMALLCLWMAGCGAPESESTSPPAVSQAGSSTPQPASEASSAVGNTTGNSAAQETAPAPESTQAILYVGMNGNFKEYPLSYEGDVSAEMLIQEMADLTGWDLSLADGVTSGKGGMTVCFAKTSALFMGPPDPQKEEFHMFDAESLSQTILDSIKKTLQMNFTGAGGNPDMLDIYYCMEGDQPLTMENIGWSWPIDQPYESFAAGQGQSQEAAPVVQGAEATLYVGMDGNFREYPFSYEGELTPALLIRGIADLTGWDLSLADVVTYGKGGMTVCFAKSGSLFMGPPDPQKEEFHMFDAESLSQTILDSIKKTLQENFTGESGDPSLLDIYYCVEGDQPLVLENIERSWTLDEPYAW